MNRSDDVEGGCLSIYRSIYLYQFIYQRARDLRLVVACGDDCRLVEQICEGGSREAGGALRDDV